jgi:hypothetical protein
MPFGTGFQLSLELTNLISPLTSALAGAGSLLLAEARKRSGSDIITESKLASTLGRNRIGGFVEQHFRKKFAKSDEQRLSRWLEDLMLESGAGPTVQQCLREPPLYSVVIQLSALAFAHELKSLSSAIVKAFEDALKDGGKKIESGVDYVSVLGTFRACQQQTAAFSWSSTFEWVEDKLLSEIHADRQPTRRSATNDPATTRQRSPGSNERNRDESESTLPNP